MKLLLKKNKIVELSKPIVKYFIKILIMVLALLNLILITDFLIEILWFKRNPTLIVIINSIMLFFTTGILFYFQRFKKSNYYVHNQFLMVWIYIGVSVLFLGLFIYRIILISHNYFNDLVLLNKMKQNIPNNPSPNFINDYKIFINIVTSGRNELIISSLIFIIIFMLILLCAVYANKINFILKAIYYHYHTKYIKIDENKLATKFNIKRGPNKATAKQIYFLKINKIVFKKNISKGEAFILIKQFKLKK